MTEGALFVPAVLRRLLLNHSGDIVIFSGAGISAESGLPTFRSGDDAFWNGFSPETLATPAAWKSDKDTVWAWYESRRRRVMEAQPNAGHLAVAELQACYGASIVTQNVDDLHERAGATDVIHLHGSLFQARCAACRAPATLGEPPAETLSQLKPPRCSRCNGFIRPGVVWFNENLDARLVRQAQRLIRQCNLLVIVGTSGVVYPAAGLVDAARYNATIIEINPALSGSKRRGCFHWQATAATGLPLLLTVLGQART